MSVWLEARLPDGRALPKDHAPGLYAQWARLKHLWADEDPLARHVRLESHVLDRSESFPDWFVLVSVNGQAILEPLPYTVLINPAQEPEMRAFVRRARFTVNAWFPGAWFSGAWFPGRFAIPSRADPSRHTNH